MGFKFRISVLALFMVLGLSVFCSAAGSGLRYPIMVAKFENRSNWGGQWNLGDAWDTVLTDSLFQSDKFIVIAEKDMRVEAMVEQDFAGSDRAAGGGKKVVKGQMTPAQLLVKGVITHFEDGTAGGGGGVSFKGVSLGGKGHKSEISGTMYIIDSSTAQVLASKKFNGKMTKKGLSIGLSKDGFDGDIGGFKKTNAGKAIEKAVDQCVAFLVDRLDDIPWSGQVILAKKGKVYINRGSREGVSVGDVFNVGEETILRDPDTGEVLDSDLDIVGKIKVVKVKEKIAVCKVISGSDIQKGMTALQPD